MLAKGCYRLAARLGTCQFLDSSRQAICSSHAAVPAPNLWHAHRDSLLLGFVHTCPGHVDHCCHVAAAAEDPIHA